MRSAPAAVSRKRRELDASKRAPDLHAPDAPASVVDDSEARGRVAGNRSPELSRRPKSRKANRVARFFATFRASAPITARLASGRAIFFLYPSVRVRHTTRAPRGAHAHPSILPLPTSPIIAFAFALITDRPPLPSIRSSLPPHFSFDPRTKITMAFSFTAARLPGSLVRAEAKPSRTGKSGRRLAPRRAIAEPAKAAGSKFTAAWKLQVRLRPNRPTSVPKHRASAPTSSADRKDSPTADRR